MSHPLVNLPQARSWRDIPQPVKPRTMSREGRWRLTTATLRATGLAAVAAALAWGGWIGTEVLRESPKKLPAVAMAVPVKSFELTTDGVLDESWLRRALALPKTASLMELDLEQLRARLLAHGQVNAANLTRKFPDTLAARIAERSPVARVMAAANGGGAKALLVARDGVVFDGVGFDPAMVATLPWLDGVKLVRQGNDLLPIEGMTPAADLLAKARLEADHLYQTWSVVSLARLQSDHELEVRTKQGTLLVFDADGDFFRQLAKLNYQWEAFAGLPAPPTKIDLSLGREVAVTFAQPPVAPGGGAVLLRPAPALVFPNFFNSQPKTKREL